MSSTPFDLLRASSAAGTAFEPFPVPGECNSKLLAASLDVKSGRETAGFHVRRLSSC
jgi:hypothetical protein